MAIPMRRTGIQQRGVKNTKQDLVEGNRYAHRWQKLFRLKLRALQLRFSSICCI